MENQNRSVDCCKGRVRTGQFCLLVLVVCALLFGAGNGSAYASVKKTSIKQVTSSANSLTVTWKMGEKSCDGYQVQISGDSTFEDSTTKKNSVSGRKNCEMHFKRLPYNKRYYVRVRCYQKKGETVYSSWSAAESVKIKQKELSLSAKSAVIIDVSNGNLWYAKNPSQKRAQASTTKLMTTLIALEDHSLKEKVKITKTVLDTPYTHLNKDLNGDSFYMKDLLYLCLLPSDNGCANALALHDKGSIEAFVKKMNRKAKAMGLKNTHYVTPHGLDRDGHYTSAYDLALLGRACIKNKTFAKITGTKNYTCKSLKKKITCKVSTTNQLLGKVDGLIGGKTGTTTNAGYCFVGFYKNGDRKYVTVVMGCDSIDGRWNDTKKLISYIKKYAAK